MKITVLLLCLLFGIAFSQISPSFDSRTGFPFCVSEILNQGSCGGCWAFGAAESFTDRSCIFGNTAFWNTNHVETSPEDIVACDPTALGCNGGWASTAWSTIVNNGVSTCSQACTAGCSPFVSVNCSENDSGANNGCTSCPTSCVDGSTWNTYNAATNGPIQAHDSLSAVEAMQTEIQANGPVESCFTVYENFFTFFAASPMGIYNQTSGQQIGGHCIRIVGWDQTGPLPFWIIANSWTTDWADQGYFRYVMGTNLGGMDESGYAGCPAGYPACQLTFPVDVKSNKKGLLAGGWSQIGAESQYIQEAFELAHAQIMATLEPQNKQQVKISIIDAYVQPVAGLNMRINVDIQHGSLPHRVATIAATMDHKLKIAIKHINL